MKRVNWMHWVLAAILVLASGVAIASAETVKLKVTQRGGEQVELDLNGDVQVIGLDDLADGELREFEAGERTVQVRRVGDQLQVMLDGEEVGSHGSGIRKMVWVGADGETHHKHGSADRVIVMKDGESDEGEMKTYVVRIETDEDCEDCEGCEGDVEIDIERIEELVESGDLASLEELEGHHMMVFKGSAEEGGPVIVKKIRRPGGDVVRYRCEESGSELILKKDDAVAETYVCPATGCVMKRVDEPEMKMIRIEREVHGEEGGEEK